MDPEITSNAVPPQSSWGLPWVEKYRPKSFDDIVGNTDTIARLKVIGVQGNMPNLLISGPPGIGKTTAITCLASILLTPSQLPEAFLELNASDERGIDVVRTNIKMFATKKVTLPSGRHKIILLDEADSMTTGAQQALRRIMEMYASTTRFALVCNHSSKIIEPIQSRCAVLRFFPPSPEEICNRLLSISNSESIRLTTDGLEALVDIAGDSGDLRQAIHTLQGAASVSLHISKTTNLIDRNLEITSLIDAKAVSGVANKPQPAELARILDFINEGKIRDSYNAISRLCSQGYAPLDITGGLFRVAKNVAGGRLSEHIQIAILKVRLMFFLTKELGLAQMRTLEGHTSKLQLLSLVSRLCTLSKPNPFSTSFISLTN